MFCALAIERSFIVWYTIVVNELKLKALNLRKSGYSYSLISKKLSVSKSTLSNWLSRELFVPNKEVLKRIGAAKLKSALYKQKQKFNDIAQRTEEAKKEIGKISERDFFMIGLGLYFGEGSKSFEEVKISNANPAIIKVAIKWFQKFCKITAKNIKITVHGYPDTDINKLVRFWSIETLIPKKQFNKVIIDRRSNKSKLKNKKLPYGTVHVYIKRGRTLSVGIKSTHRKIIGWIEAVIKQII